MEPNLDTLANGYGIPGSANVPERTVSRAQTKTPAVEEAVKASVGGLLAVGLLWVAATLAVQQQ
ncbi:MAG TPA: hypothetical protein VLG13_02490 [Patescibacteria group bacterium]|nr:hypothetical protein [Patescibacteria group bacterium]